MKPIIIAVSVLILVSAIPILAQTKSGSVEQELIKLEKQWGDAMVKGDLAFLDQILAGDYTGIDVDGLTVTKAQFLANLKSKEDVYTSWVMDECKVSVYGDAAIANGLSTGKEQYKGKDISGQYRWLDTWIKKGGRWQCVASVAAKVAQK
jgi:hypothetical protein